jgi:uncharacterized UPF0160 family protein
LTSGCTERDTIVQRYDVVEYNLGSQYFIYIDNNDNFIRISYDSTGWNSNPQVVAVIKSNETYVNKTTISAGAFGLVNVNEYELYINTTGVQIQ